jgi:hypothetical protein
MPGLRRLRGRPKRSDGPRRANARSHRLSPNPQLNEGKDTLMVANSRPSGCSSGRARCAPPFPWSDMALLCLVAVGAVFTGLLTFVTAFEAVARGFEWMGCPQAEGSAYLLLFAAISGGLAMWRTGLSAAHKVQEMSRSSTFLSRGNLITYFTASAVAVVMGVTMWWLTQSSSGWHVAGTAHAVFSAVMTVLVPVVLVWVVTAHLVHKWVSK